MRQTDALIPASTVPDQVEVALARFASERQVLVRNMGSLRTFPGSVHWHLSRRGAGQGTVEITLLQQQGLLRASVHENRQGTWAGDGLDELVAAIVRYLTAP
jgi:hypothetical protein